MATPVFLVAVEQGTTTTTTTTKKPVTTTTTATRGKTNYLHESWTLILSQYTTGCTPGPTGFGTTDQLAISLRRSPSVWLAPSVQAMRTFPCVTAPRTFAKFGEL